MIIPSIDLMGGKAVQLRQGKEKVLEREDVIELAKYYGRFGEIAVVDLDAAFGTGDNEELIKQICKVAHCRVGGGIRSVEKAKRMIANGAKKIIIGTAANEIFLSQLPKSRVMVAIDARDGKVTTEGWKVVTGSTPQEYVERFKHLCCGFLYTIVENEGMEKGTNINAIKAIREITDLELVAAGGISTIDEVVELQRMNVSTQLGMAIYTGKLKLEDIFAAVIDFKKCDGLVPTIVQDVDTKQVLMLAYSNAESLKKSLKEGRATYYSRSRKKLWTKGETSGNAQELVSAKFDCDADSILFKVKQQGVACHLGRYSCFEDMNFNIKQLYDLIVERKEKMPENSYTTKLFKDEHLIKRKIMEEAFEIVTFKEGSGIEWETADFIYHLLVYLVKNNASWQDVIDNLSSRAK